MIWNGTDTQRWSFRNGELMMEDVIRDMIESANNHHDYEMADIVYKLLSQFAGTFNCPYNWLDLGELMAQEYVGNDWVMENCRLWDFE